MTIRIPLMLLASAILLTPRPSVSESPDFFAPSTCAATSSSPELPLFSQAESERLPRAMTTGVKCGTCSSTNCRGASEGARCGVTSGGWIMYCSDNTNVCSQDGLAWCVCERWRQ
jgi:hypothetical protein